MTFESTSISKPEDSKPEDKIEKENIPVIAVETWLKFSGPFEKSNAEFQKFLEDKGIKLNSGIQKVRIEGGQVEIFTDKERFGSIVQNSDMIFEK